MSKIILIADDYDDARGYMVLLIKSYGYEVFEARNGKEAIELAKKHHPDLILMDISMPEMDGLQATQIIRKSNAEIAKVPIIAITAFDDSYKEKVLKAGCNQLIAKPVDFHILESVINKYLLP